MTANTQSYYGYGKYPVGPSDIYNLRIDSSYTQANTANVGAQDAYTRAEAAFFYANTISGGPYADNVARVSTNVATIKVAAAYNQANLTIGVDATQNANIIIIQGVNTSQNARMTIIEGTNTSQNTRMSIIEGTNTTQNTNIAATDGKMQNAYFQANTGTVLAQAAYAAVNNFTATTTTDNLSRVTAQSAFLQANTALAQTVYLQTIEDSQNSSIIVLQNINIVQNAAIAATDAKMLSSYEQSNTINTFAIAAFLVANTAAANTVYTQTVDNSQNASIIVIQGTDVSQNARIAIIEGTDVTQNVRMTIIEGVDSTQNTNISNKLSLTGAATQTVSGNVYVSGFISGNINAATALYSTASAGYLGVPQNNISSVPYTLALSDAGKHLYITATGTITVPTNASVAFPTGTIIGLINASSVTTTISASSITLYISANTTTRTSVTMLPAGASSLTKVATDTWYISGAGIY
jgi:hypothetical protein